MSEPTLNPNAVPETGFSWRSLALGTLMVVVIGVMGPYATMYLRASFLFLDYSTAGATFLLFLLIVLLNFLVGRFWRWARLSRAELALIAIMMIVACAIPTATRTRSVTVGSQPTD